MNPLALLGPVANLAGTWLEGHVATKKAKTEAKIVTIKSEAKIKERQATGRSIGISNRPRRPRTH